MGKIVIDYHELQNIQQTLLGAAARLSEVANGAYVTGDVFLESTGDTAAAWQDLLDVLAESATNLFTLLMEAAHYFELVIDGFQNWDKEQANGFIDAFGQFMKDANRSADPYLNQLPGES